MIPVRLARYETMLGRLGDDGRRRVLRPRDGIDFTSNDYIGLAASRRLADAVTAAVARGVAVGAGGSRLLRGNHAEHEALEAEAAVFFGAERALFFGSGYAANEAIFSTLPQRGDLVVHDALIHASARAGMAAGRADIVAAPHNDAGAVDDAIRQWRAGGGTGHPWIAVESIYSMDGDQAPLAELAGIADRHDGFLIVDEAHATGVFGPDGRGLTAALEGRDTVVVLHTCGKALGSAGALVTGSGVLCDFLVNRGRGFIYATAPSPLVTAAVREALRVLKDEPERRVELQRRVAAANEQVTRRIGIAGSLSQIVPVIVGENGRTMRVAAAMQARGFDIRGIRPPTVPEGTARLRIAITLNVDTATIVRMVDGLSEVLTAEAA